MESSALGAFVLSRALALNGMQASDVNVVHLESNEQPSAFENGLVDGAVTFDPYRAQFLRAGAATLFDSTQIPGEIVDLMAVRATVLEKQPKAIQALLNGWFSAIDYMNRQPGDAAQRMGIRQQTTGEEYLAGSAGPAYSVPGGKPHDDRWAFPAVGRDRAPAHRPDAGSKAAALRARNRTSVRTGPASEPAAVTFRIPTSLKVTVPLILLGFAATLSAVNLLYHVPQAERAAEEDSRKRWAQEMSRLQSTLEYLLLKGDLAAAQHEIAVLAHNHDVVLAALTDDRNAVIAATRRAWLGRQIAEVFPKLDLNQTAGAIRERRAGMTIDPNGNELLGYAGILMGGDREELRSSRTGTLFLAYDLERYKEEARAQVLQQSLYWAGWVTALALAMWLVFHFLLTRRTARLVRAAEQLSAGNLAARSGLRGSDELGRLSRAFDSMALEVADTQTRLRSDIAERARVQQALENSEACLQQILNNTTAVVFVKDTEGRFMFVNRQFERLFHLRQTEVAGRTDREILPEEIAQAFRANDRLVLQRNAPIEFEETVPLDDGLHTYISIKFPLHDANGVAYAVCGIATDITERKRSDEALRVSEASHRAIFDAAEDSIFVHDIETGAIVDVNPKACATFGYTREEFRQIDVGMLGYRRAPLYPARRHGADRTCGCRGATAHRMARQKQGLAFCAGMRCSLSASTIGGQDRILAIARDITGRKKAEAALRASEEQYHAIFNASIDGLALWNAAGEIVDYQSGALADVRLWRRRVLHIAAGHSRGPVVSPASFSGR